MLSSWVGHDCCRWEGVRCDVATGSVVSLHLRGNVKEVYSFHGESNLVEHLYKDDLVGEEVKSSLAELRHLKYLDLSGNDFQGSRIPEFIGSLKQLTYLNLSNAGFSGIIPHHIGNLSNLEVLDLTLFSYKQLKEDDMAWVSGLSLLKHLDLSGVDLSGAQNVDMVLYMIPSLIELSFSSCGLSNADLGHHLNPSRTLPNIRHLDLSFNSFEGQLPGFFKNMTSLAFLDLSFFSLPLNSANLLNMIPSLSELHLLRCGLHNKHLSPTHLNFNTHSNIQHLDLSWNSIEGRFPSVLTNMSSLRVLDLSQNSLNSSIPVMPNLLKLDLSDNNFEQIKHVGIWRQCHLKQLSVSRNFFGEEMIGPSTNVSECSQYALEMLYLSENQLNGSIPESLSRLTNLRVLDLSSNRLTSLIPEALGRLRLLEVLDLFTNQLNGSIPESLRRLTNLRVLDLSSNGLTGLIPEALGRLRLLEVLDLASNQLNGPIPTFLERLASLQVFSVSSNLLNGAIPVSIGQLIRLDFLDVSNNSLGVVSEAHFANLSMLKHLDTTSNSKLTFNVSRESMPPFQLRTARLGSCKIAYEFPMWFRTQRKLEQLELSNASISRPLPTWLRKMPIIPLLDLSHNKLSGPLTNLPLGDPLIGYGDVHGGSLLLQNNLFNGSIPRSFCRRTDLRILELSRNRLTGKIPNCLENLQHLSAMIFSSNGLSGVIPSSLGDISPSLKWLSLNDNNFIGELPRDLGNLRFLEVLDLGGNKFSGNITEWIGEKLRRLNILRLHKNNFTGRIPPSLCKNSNLQILDVAHNSLTGPIPYCFGELNGMVEGSQTGITTGDFDVSQVINGVYREYTTILQFLINMDLSSNKLVGEIPEEVTTLSGLVGLNLSHNHLNGGIPNGIGNMKALISLDFSENELTGMFPPSMANLNFLSHLNLSHNNFSGQIPIGNQLQTLTDPSIYAGNRDLCGAPLPKNCSNHEDPTTITSQDKYEAADEPKKVWFYLDIMCGFATGFWSVIGVLLFKKRWRHKLFTFAEVTMDKIHVSVAVRVSKMKRGREAA